MGCLQEDVLEFDDEVQAPWRPRLALAHGAGDPDRPPARTAQRQRAPRVAVCRPSLAPEVRARPDALPRQARRSVDGSGRLGVSRPVSRSRHGHAPSARTPAVGLRLTRRARRLAVVLALAVGLALGSWVGLLVGGVAGAGADLRLAGESSVVVQEGDTLWSIASSVAGESDVRAVVDEIQRLNGLQGGRITPGQVVHLP